MNIPANRLKQALREDRPQIGLWLSLADAYAAEVVAGAGADWVLLDGEHSPLTIDKTLAMLQATEAAGVSVPVVRPLWNDMLLIKQLLDIGVTTLLLPNVQTAEEAIRAVSCTRYPPRGVRGVASGAVRASRFGRIPDYMSRCEDELCLLVQIETRRGLDNLAADLGHPGKPGHPEVVAAVEDAIRRIVACGKAPGVLSVDEELVHRYVAAGSLLTAVGLDIVLLARAAEGTVRKFKQG